jgi:hypothetical protein
MHPNSNKGAQLNLPSPLPPIKKKEYNDLEIVVGIYRLLTFDFKKYSIKWNYSRLLKFMELKPSSVVNDQRQLVKWITLKIVSHLLCLVPIKENELFQLYFKTSEIFDLNERYHQIFMELNGSLVLHQHSKQTEILKKIKTNFTKLDLELNKRECEKDNDNDDNDAENEDDLSSKKQVIIQQRSDNSFNLKNLNLLIDSHSNNDNFSSSKDVIKLVNVKSTSKNLDHLSMAVLTDSSILIEGPLSSGKTTLIEYLAQQTNNKLIKYQMDEFMDSKSLIGNYICSEIPGEFVWKPGPLYQVIINQLLFESRLVFYRYLLILGTD